MHLDLLQGHGDNRLGDEANAESGESCACGEKWR
jgi:hypothetical protein